MAPSSSATAQSPWYCADAAAGAAEANRQACRAIPRTSHTGAQAHRLLDLVTWSPRSARATDRGARDPATPARPACPTAAETLRVARRGQPARSALGRRSPAPWRPECRRYGIDWVGGGVL